MCVFVNFFSSSCVYFCLFELIFVRIHCDALWCAGAERLHDTVAGIARIDARYADTRWQRVAHLASRLSQLACSCRVCALARRLQSRRQCARCSRSYAAALLYRNRQHRRRRRTPHCMATSTRNMSFIHSFIFLVFVFRLVQV